MWESPGRQHSPKNFKSRRKRKQKQKLLNKSKTDTQINGIRKKLQYDGPKVPPGRLRGSSRVNVGHVVTMNNIIDNNSYHALSTEMLYYVLY